MLVLTVLLYAMVFRGFVECDRMLHIRSLLGDTACRTRR